MNGERRSGPGVADNRGVKVLVDKGVLLCGCLLLALIVRICAIEWRGKINSDTWRARWDYAHTISAWLPAILWGAAFANLVQGMQIEVVEVASRKVVPVSEALAAQSAGTLIPGASHEITGGFWSLIPPFPLLGGLVTCSLFLTHGALFAALKTAGGLSKRCSALALTPNPPRARPTPGSPPASAPPHPEQ